MNLIEECVTETFTRFLNAIRNGKGPKDNRTFFLLTVNLLGENISPRRFFIDIYPH